MTPPERPPRFGLHYAAIALGLLVATACGTSASWLKRRSLRSFALPTQTTLMVHESGQFRELGAETIANRVAATIQYELGARGIEITIVPLKGEPRVPRIQLVFRSFEFRQQLELGSYLAKDAAVWVVDCAVVTENDEVAFVGRLQGTSAHVDEIERGAVAAGQAIAELLEDGG